MTTTMLTACGSKSNNQSQEQGETSELVINLDSIVIKPYLAFGNSLADVEKFMSENYADWEVKNPDSLECFPNGEEQSWGRSYGKGTHGMEFDFNDASLTGVYKVSVYATKAGYVNSNAATKEIQLSSSGGAAASGDMNGDGVVMLVNYIAGK